MNAGYIDVIYEPTNERITSTERLTELFNECLKMELEAYKAKIKAEFAFTRKGRKKGLYKLSTSDIINIGFLRHFNGLSYRKLADMYDVSEKTIRNYLKF